ncbi:NAD(P)-binding protein [Hysterangium stoloniferum]|nr:NAD(P)-binding protein [Hysterangium stoloniferum]
MANVVIVGGHGKIALCLTRLLAQNSYNVISVIRDASQSKDITDLAAKPHVLSLEDTPASTLTTLFSSSQLVYFTAGAGGKGGPERTRTVDYEGAVKVFDAVEGIQGEKPRVILVSAIDARNPDKLDQYPAHYTEEDKKVSQRAHEAIGTYYKWKFEADKNLVARTAFDWTILRPSGLTDGPRTGLVEVGRTHLTPAIARDDVAEVLFHLASRPEARGLTLDLISGKTTIPEALDTAIKRRETDYTD